MTLTFTLPWPPSVNTYWRHTVRGGKFKKARSLVYLSEQGERYRTHAILSMNTQRVPKGALKGRLAVHVVAYPPDNRARDLDNLPKGVLDALKHAGVIVDDSHIDDLHIVRGPVRPDGLLEMRVSEIAHEPAALDLFAPTAREGIDEIFAKRRRRTSRTEIVNRPSILDRDPF